MLSLLLAFLYLTDASGLPRDCFLRLEQDECDVHCDTGPPPPSRALCSSDHRVASACPPRTVTHVPKAQWLAVSFRVRHMDSDDPSAIHWLGDLGEVT